MPTQKESEYKTLAGKPVERIDFSSIYTARDFLKKAEGIIPVYGMTQFVYPYINDTFPGEIKFNFSDIKVGILDIEVGSDDGFPQPDVAKKEVTAITCLVNGIYHTFGCGEFTPHMKNVNYYKCRNEKDLLRKFLLAWKVWDLDIVTGWNSEFFDIPYLVNRLRNLFGDSTMRQLSPWGIVYPRVEKDGFGNEQTTYVIVGMASVDYMKLYKKHAYIPQEKYNLDTVAFTDLGVSKIDYSEYRDLHTLYRENFQKFAEYNIRDCELIERLDKLHGLMNVVILLALDSKTTFADAFGSVRQWDAVIHNDLISQKIVVDPQGQERKTEQFKGAFVKPPQIGMHKYVVAFDIKALYPSLIWQMNISPETYRGRLNTHITIEACMNKIPLQADIVEHLEKNNQTLTANGCLWDKDIEGVFPRLVKKSLADRDVYKKRMFAAQQKYEETKEQRYKNEAQLWKVLQYVRKIQINSLYGCLGNEFFRWFRIDSAESITFTGQFTIKWLQKRLNEELNKLANTHDVDFIIAMDTDSAYVTLDAFVPKDLFAEERIDFLIKFTDDVIATLLQQIFTEILDMLNGVELVVAMKREAIADKAFWTAKKRYALNLIVDEGVRYKIPKVKVAGLESVKSSTPTFCRKTIAEAIRLILQDTEDNFQQYVTKTRTDYKTLAFDDIAFPKGVNGVRKYAHPETIYGYKTPAHTKGALFFNHLVKKLDLEKVYEPIRDGEKIKWAYVQRPNPMNVEVIACPQVLPKEFNLEKYIDYDTMFSKSFMEPVGKMASAAGWRMDTHGTLEGAWDAGL